MVMEIEENDTDEFRHTTAIATLAKDLKVSVEEVSRFYESELQEIKKSARILDFVTLLVSKRVKDLLKTSRQ
jgi:hypothetical protein